jgi:hypothetical protein
MLLEKLNEKPRLIINKIVMENFKSYYGVKEVGPFHESFTCNFFLKLRHCW